MSIASAPGDVPFYRESNSAVNAPALSVVVWNSKNEASRRRQKLTGRGRLFFKEIKVKNRESASKHLQCEIDRINKLLKQSTHDLERLQSERSDLDALKEKLNVAQQEYDDLLISEKEREESYRWFDLKDRGYSECRMRLCEEIQVLERAFIRSVTKDDTSNNSLSSKRNSNKSWSSKKSSSSSVLLARANSAAKAAKLQVEMSFLENETKLKRLQLEKEIEIAKAEERALCEVLNKPIEKTNAINKSDERKVSEVKLEMKQDSEDFERVDSFPNRLSLNPQALPFQPSMNTALQEIVNLQAKQTELCSLIINQQRANMLPIKEPPLFSGNPFDYPAFITAFDIIISNNAISDHDRLYFLDKYTRGKANSVVKGFLATNSEQAYQSARKLLDSRYGNPVHVAEAYKASLRRWPQIKDGDSNAILEFSDFLIKCETALKTMQSMSELNSTQILFQLSAKLPSYLGVKWCRHAHEQQVNYGKPATFSEFVMFVNKEAELANDPIFSPEALLRERKRANAHNYSKSNDKAHIKTLSGQTFLATARTEEHASTSIHRTTSDQACPACKGRHNLAKCNTFLAKSVEERSEFIRLSKLCFRCFKEGHVSAKCQSKQSCQNCGKGHHTLLHGAKPKIKRFEAKTQSSCDKEVESGGISSMSTNPVTANGNASSSLFVSGSKYQSKNIITNCKIVPVIIYHKDNPTKEVKVYALLDDASDTTFVTEGLKEKLGIKGVTTRLSLSTMLGRQVIETSKIDGLVVERFDRGAKVELPKAYTKEIIPTRYDQIPTPSIADNWPHLKRIKDKIQDVNTNICVGLLIGCNCPKAIKPKEVIIGKSEDPYAVRTLLGWCIVGPVSPPDLDNSEDISSCNSTVACEMLPHTNETISIVLQCQGKEVIEPSTINKMFALDFVEHKKTAIHGTSKEDRKFLEIAENGIHKCSDGHYELPLPLRDLNIHFPNNRAMALNRLNYLKNKFSHNASFREDYQAFMSKMIDNGYAEKVESVENMASRVWYIPHHGVYHPKKPSKIRVVFDCATQYKGESLNKYLLQGPDLTNNLVGVLQRFRQEQIAFTCDIEGMFHQVKVNKEDRDLLRFLWWENGDTTKEPKEYRMTVHLFGATSSPGCANFTLKRTAKDNEEIFGKETADFLRNDFYVHDGLKSVCTTTQAIKLIHDVKEMCSKGGFHLHKFISNSKEVIRNIPEKDRAEDIKELNLDLDALPLERTLGVQWCVESDCFKFNIMLQDKPCTRRGILSTISSIFDPIGFVAPLMLEGKSILQELCGQDLDWDDPIPEGIKARWERWRTEVLQLKSFSVARCFKPKDFGSIVSSELHHFSDASSKGYGQCSYLRLVDENERIHCTFVTGKSRVAPLKPVTIPRLELTAAVCSVRVGEQLHRELEYSIDRYIYWTDSKVVLGYVQNESKRFHVFVANRVQEIQERTSMQQWKYIDTKQNPADEASRGMKVREFSTSRWICGPEFLQKKENEWPVTDNSKGEVSSEDPEVKKAIIMATTSDKRYASIEERLDRFSSWYKAKKAVAICIQYVRKLKARAKNSDIAGKEMRVRDLETAEHLVLREVQHTAFKEEIAALQATKQQSDLHAGNCLKVRGSLYRLDPFLDENKIFRVGGRLRRANLPEEVKFPIILPKRSHISNLIIRHFHEKISHQGKDMTLNEIRSTGFWIVNASSSVFNVISSCVTCQKLRGTVQEQKMSDLPEDRMDGYSPFTYCAVDCFGPFIIKEGRKELKRYGVLFTCMASRAVHVEIANSLTTDSFINAYRRFVSRRGPIRQLRSDQGSNFVGARRELAKALNEMDQQKIKNKLLEDNCDWFNFKMNTPASSHMGGVWERQIRSVRNVLSSLLQNNGRQLDDESLITLMCEAEAIVNSRPLTVNNLTDPDSLSPLTPNHLLTMKTKVLLSPPGAFQSADLYSRKRWRRVQHLANEFWSRWRKEFLTLKQQRQKWTQSRKDLQVDDVVIMKDDNLPRSEWKLARVSAVYPSADGFVRKVQVVLADDCLDKDGKRINPLRYLERPVQKLVLLPTK